MRICFFLLLLLVLCAPSGAIDIPTPSAEDERIVFVTYTPHDVVKIIGRARISTQIIFAETEEVVYVGGGDNVAWETAVERNTLFLKPREQHPPTNLQVITQRENGDRRYYSFEVHAASETEPVYFSVRFVYPQDALEKDQLAERKRRLAEETQHINHVLSQDQDYGARNFAYSVQGNFSLQPESVYDDGQVTSFIFAGNRALPAIYQILENGEESLVPGDVREGGQKIVIHGIARQFVLRSGKQVLCVYNEAYDPVGVHFGTGTISPSVSREMVLSVQGGTR